MTQAILDNTAHPEYGVATIPFPIPRAEYANCVALLEALEIGDARDRDCQVQEFLLLSRPVITLGTISKDIYWENITEPDQLIAAYDHALTDPEAIAKRQWIVDNYDPYLDGNVCQRMLDGAEDYIRRHGVPKNRKLNLWRKYTSIKTFGRIKKE